MAATHACKEAIWLRALLKDLGHEQTHATLIYEDNQGCIQLAKNPIHHRKTKHIDIQYHFVREKVESKEIELEHCSSGSMIADICTKPLPGPKYKELRELLGMTPNV